MVAISLITILLAISCLPLLLFCFWNRNSKNKNYEKIPGPKPLPIIGNALDFCRNHVDMFTWVMGELASYGPVVKISILGDDQVVISGAEQAEKLLKGTTHLSKSNSYRFLHDWLGLALLTSQGERWRVYRKVLTPAFHFNILNDFLPIFMKHSMIMIEKLTPQLGNQKGFDIFHHASLCTLDIICESSMGAEIHAQENHKSPYVKSVMSVMDLITHRYISAWLRPDFLFKFSSTKREMDKHLKIIDEFADKVITERREYLKTSSNAGSEKKEDRRCMAFLDLLLSSEEKYPEFLTQRDIRGNVSAFMFAGYDTVTTSTSWTLFLLGTYPHIQDKVVDELESVFGDTGRSPNLDDLSKLKYLERCIKESLRIYPSAAFFERTISQDTQLDNYMISAGCTATFNVFALHRDPKYFPDPEKFDPDRFLPENCANRNPYAYMPFSAGARNCIGQKFAILEEKVVMSTILRRFRVEAAHSRQQATLKVGMILRPENGLQIRIADRISHPHLKVSAQY